MHTPRLLSISLCLLAWPVAAEQPPAQDTPQEASAPSTIIVEPLGRLDPEVAAQLNRADGGSRAPLD